MSTTAPSAAELGTTLAASLVERGLEVQAVTVQQAGAAVAGPLLVIRLPLRAGSGVEVCVVAADRGADGSAEQVVQALAHTVAGTLGDLVAGDASMEAAESLAPVVGAFTAPAEVGLVLRSGAPIGAVLWSVDRRQPSSAPGAQEPPGSSRLAELGGAAPASGTVHGFGHASMQLLRDVSLDVSVELGRTVMTVAEVLELSVGSVVELDRAARAPVDIRVNGTLLAKGEVVVIDDEYAVRVTEILDPGAGIG